MNELHRTLRGAALCCMAAGAVITPLWATAQTTQKVPIDLPVVDLYRDQPISSAPSTEVRFAPEGPRSGATTHPDERALEQLAGEPALPHFTPSNDPRQHFQIDQPGDGRIWVYGGSYKASFGREGATYIPAFGPDAPRNFPVSFRLGTVTSGGEPLALDTTAQPRLWGRRIEFERGACTERYDVALGQAEQSFVFRSVPSAGDLVLEIEVASELTAVETAQGLSWQNDLGRVDYSRAVAIDAKGRRLELATSLVEGEVHLVVPAAFVASAAFPLVVDPLLTTWTVSSGAGQRFVPDIAYDHTADRFYVVYEQQFSLTDNDVFGILVDPVTGFQDPSSGAFVDFTSVNFGSPSCANNRLASQFFVAMVRRGAIDEIFGRTREAEDTTQSPLVQVSSGVGKKASPDVGGDLGLVGPTSYCVTWERELATSIDHDIHARLVGTNGFLSGSLVLIDNSPDTVDRKPRISKHNGLAPADTQAWNIVWTRFVSAGNGDIHGAQVRRDGFIITAPFVIDTGLTHHLNPDVSSPLDASVGGRPYLVVYDRFEAGDNEVIARELVVDQVRNELNVSDRFAKPANVSDLRPMVETDSSQYVVTWLRQTQAFGVSYNLLTAGIYSSLTALRVSEAPTVVTTALFTEDMGRMATPFGVGPSGQRVGIVWTDRQTDSNIEGATYELLSGFGTGIGSRYCSPAVPNTTGQSGRIDVGGVGIAGGLPLHLTASQLPPNVFCYFLASPAAASTTTPATSGVVCVGNPLSRFNGPGQIGNSGAAGRIDLEVDTLAIPLPSGGSSSVQAGTTLNFQAWYRDDATNNLTDAIAVLFR